MLRQSHDCERALSTAIRTLETETARPRLYTIDEFNNPRLSIPEIEFTDRFTDQRSTPKQILNANSFRANGLNVLPANWPWFAEYTPREGTHFTELPPPPPPPPPPLFKSSSFDQDSQEILSQYTTNANAGTGRNHHRLDGDDGSSLIKRQSLVFTTIY